MNEAVLSLFPGLDLLGRAFHQAGFIVLRGPDKILDEAIEDFHGKPGLVTGIVGGPPCQNYSTMNRHRRPEEGDRLVVHMLRVIHECKPEWFVIENVPQIPDVAVEGYDVQRLDLTDVECGGTTKRLRHIQFGSTKGDIIRPTRTSGRRRVTAAAILTKRNHRHERHCRRAKRQGAETLRLSSFTRAARDRLIGNAVPATMAQAIATAVTKRGPVTARDCVCRCGREIAGKQKAATPACRKRMERRRRNQVRTLTFP